MSKISEHFDVRDFVPKEVYSVYGENSKWFVSHSVVNMAEFIYQFFDKHLKEKDPNIKSIQVLINNWASGGTFNNRGLRTIDYINDQISKGVKTAHLSQHIGGATNAVDFNIIITYMDGKTITMKSNDVRGIILENEKVFLENGLTTLEDEHFAPGWCHADCRWTGLDHILIVKP